MRSWPAAMACPDENRLGDFAQGDMDPQERAEIEAHLDECPECSGVVSELARIFASAFGSLGESESEPEPEPSMDGADRTLGPGESDPGWSRDLPLPEGAKLGRYVVLEAIGAGAMGIVYAAYDPQLDRKVALKLLRRGTGEASIDAADTQSSRNKRMLREAQALARVAHPHVIAVHDVGTFDDQVFLAMEFVDGGTLTEWLRAETPRPWREVLRVFRQAGEGLAAAHEAGLVHRDFKPDNVLLHGSGRAVVTDFGLARPLGSASDHEPSQRFDLLDSLRNESSASALSETLTQTGALVGTPAYMAPEQLAGQRSDAKSDQFGFCVALYEGLYGERPFAARSLSALIHAIDQGRISPPPKGREAPRWLRRAILRGLQVEPAQRHPDMRSLLTALRPKRLGTWRSVAGMGIMSLGAAAGAAALVGAPAAQTPTYCDDVAAKLEGVWDPAVRDQMHQSFARSGLSFSGSVADRVAGHLDRYAEQWIDAQTDACTSEQGGHEPDAVIAVRMTCLAQRRSMLDVMGRTLAGADVDADTVLGSIDAVYSLPSPHECADVSALGQSLPPVPDDEREAVEAVRSLLHEAGALRSLGKAEPSHAKAVEAVEAARRLDYGPVRAEAQADLATALHEIGQVEAAENAMHEALAAGIAHDHDRVVAEAAAALAHLEITRMGQSEDIERWVELGLAALESQGGRHLDLRANLAASRGDAQRRSGRLAAALETLHGVLKLREQQWGPDHYSLAEPLGGLGLAYAETGDEQQSIRHIERARTILRQTYGEQHPHYAVTLQQLGTTHFVHGHYARALELYRESQRLFEQGLGPRHPSTAVLAYNVATVLAFTERYEDALTFAHKAQAVEHEIHGARSRPAATSWSLVGEIHLRAGRPEQAIDAIERAIEITQENSSDDIDRLANYRSQLGLALLLAGRPEQAQSRLTDALTVQRESSGEPSVEVAETMGRLAMVHLALGRISEARTMIDASARQYEQADHDPHQHAEAWFRRAQVMAAAGEHDPARAEATRALSFYEERGDQPSRTEQIAAWLAGLR